MKDMEYLHLARGTYALAPMMPRCTTKKPSHGSPSRKRYAPFSRFITFENELISAMPAEGRPAKIRERSSEFAITR
jgi:hypothetical protein